MSAPKPSLLPWECPVPIEFFLSLHENGQSLVLQDFHLQWHLPHILEPQASSGTVPVLGESSEDFRNFAEGYDDALLHVQHRMNNVARSFDSQEALGDPIFLQERGRPPGSLSQSQLQPLPLEEANSSSTRRDPSFFEHMERPVERMERPGTSRQCKSCKAYGHYAKACPNRPSKVSDLII